MPLVYTDNVKSHYSSLAGIKTILTRVINYAELGKTQTESAMVLVYNNLLNTVWS